MASLSPRIDAIQSYRNLLINGATDFNQRFGSGNATVTSGQQYVVDRWNFRAGGGGQNYTVSTSSIVPTNGPFKYSVRMLRNGGSNIAMTQPIEAAVIRPYIGRTMTFSFWVNYSGGSITAAVYTPVSATEDTWNSIIILNDTLYTSSVLSTGLTGQWLQLSLTFVVPATAVNGLAVSVQPSGHSGAETVNITGCMLTEGNFVPPYFYRAGDSIGHELAMCERFCEKTYDIDVTPGTVSSNGHSLANGYVASGTVIDAVPIRFRTRKRAIPSITTYGTTGVSGQLFFLTAPAAGNFTAGLQSIGQTGFETFTNSASGMTTGQAVSIRGHYIATAEL